MRYLWLLLALLLVGYGLTGCVQVRPGERALVRRFGRVLEHKPGPGLWIGLPWGMDRVDRIAVDKIQSASVGYQDDVADKTMPAGQLLTGDHNLVNIQVTLFYKVNGDEVEAYVAEMERVEGLITRAAETVLAQWVATRTVDDVLLNAKSALRPVLTAGTRERLADYRMGVDILDARVVLLSPPDDVKPAFENVVRAQTAMETRRNAALQEARRLEQQTSSDIIRIELETKSYVEKVTALARVRVKNFRAELSAFLAEKGTNPNYLRQVWDREMLKLARQMQQKGEIGVLDDLLHKMGIQLNSVQTPKQ